jgi:hypothetical protein
LRNNSPPDVGIPLSRTFASQPGASTNDRASCGAGLAAFDRLTMSPCLGSVAL